VPVAPEGRATHSPQTLADPLRCPRRTDGLSPASTQRGLRTRARTARPPWRPDPGAAGPVGVGPPADSGYPAAHPGHESHRAQLRNHRHYRLLRAWRPLCWL